MSGEGKTNIEDVRAVSTYDGEQVVIYSDRGMYRVPLDIYREVRSGIPLSQEGCVVRPSSVINYLDEENPAIIDAQIEYRARQLLSDAKKEENKPLLYALCGGLFLICAALAYVIITKSADVAVTTAGTMVATGG